MSEAFYLKICYCGSTHIRDTHPKHQRVNEIANNNVLAMNGLVLGKPLVGMERMVIHGDHAKQMIICFGNSLSGPMSIYIAYFEFFEVAAKWTVVGAHKSLRWGRRS
jgi:hypothetical protein